MSGASPVQPTPATVVFIHGPPACGKLTIAREVCALTGFALFHNHLVVDLLLSLFPFGSPEFVRHRERMWLDLIGDAVAAGESLVFTFNPERTVKSGFPERFRECVAGAGGAVRFVEVLCSEEEIEARMEAASRKEHGKLNSLAFYRELKREGAFEYPAIESEHVIDSTSASPQESARRIIDELAVMRVSRATDTPPG
ncbi:MAG TPA: shikimate kinase [Opitutaceae bacterium]|nr:shikimate kinase [Opitutaceae bacterium]